MTVQKNKNSRNFPAETHIHIFQKFYAYRILFQIALVVLAFFITYTSSLYLRPYSVLLHNGVLFSVLATLTALVSPWAGTAYAGGIILLEALYVTDLATAIAEGVFLGIAIIVTEIIREKFEQLKHEAVRDELTGLYNRRMIMPMLEKMCHRGSINKEKCALLIIDIDFFKTINDTYGHEVGDLILKDFASRLSEAVRPSDIVARIGGDEFLVLLQQIHATQNLHEILARLQSKLSKPYKIGALQIDAQVSCGVAVFPDDAKDSHKIFDVADKNLYMAKNQGRNSFFMSGKIISS